MKYVYGEVVSAEFGTVSFVLSFGDNDRLYDKWCNTTDIVGLIQIINLRSVTADGISAVFFPFDVFACVSVIKETDYFLNE